MDGWFGVRGGGMGGNGVLRGGEEDMDSSIYINGWPSDLDQMIVDK
jgi:hypothetical protein